MKGMVQTNATGGVSGAEGARALACTPNVWASCGTQVAVCIPHSPKLSDQSGMPIEVNTDSDHFAPTTRAIGSKKCGTGSTKQSFVAIVGVLGHCHETPLRCIGERTRFLLKVKVYTYEVIST